MPPICVAIIRDQQTTDAISKATRRYFPRPVWNNAIAIGSRTYRTRSPLLQEPLLPKPSPSTRHSSNGRFSRSRSDRIHVHLLICSNTPPEAVMTSCKRWATRALREAGLLGKDPKVWTRHGSTRWINDEDSLNKAFQYITEFQEGPKAEKRYRRTRAPN